MPDVPAWGLAALLLAGLALVASLVTLALSLRLNRQVAALDRRLSGLTRGSDGRSLEGVLEAHLERIYNVVRDVETVQARTNALDARTRHAVQRVGFVRFNPFPDTGSDQSFALALLDGEEDGLVLSSLHSRQATRVYAKPINGGRSDAPLSAEEAEALRIARSNASDKRSRVSA